jgi:hypothetical protein
MTAQPKGNRSWNPRLEWLLNVALGWDSDVCLLWPFAVDRDGYGRIKVKQFESRSHRVIFALKFGRWPDPCALHSCDTPGCCNLRHIREGTNQENQQDKVDRGRSLKGEQQHDAKLTDNIVRKARQEYQPYKMSYRHLAMRYGVSAVAMKWAITGKTWRHVERA